MELLAGETLLRKNKESVSADDALADKEIVAFYFSAHWCPPCKMFTPILADFYAALMEAEKSFEVIFVSSDETMEEMFSYMEESHGDWLTVPLASELKMKLADKFGIDGIPTLVVLKKDGTILVEDAIIEVETKGPKVYDEWNK